METQLSDTKSRLLAKLIRELLAAETFGSVADLTDALKARCARLRIRCSADDITDAYRLIESNRPLPGLEPIKRLEHVEPVAEPAISHREAVKILATLGVQQVPTMTAVRELSDEEIRERHWRADQRKAYRMVQQLILETAEHVAALEAAVEAARAAEDKASA